MLESLCFVTYLTMSSGGIWRHLRHPVLDTPVLIRSVSELHAQYLRQDVFTPAARRIRVQFARGRSSASLPGQVHGYHTIDYVLSVHAQQRLTVRLMSASPFLLMGIYAPNSAALCVETCNDQWTGMLPHLGDYTIRVGLVRAEARRQGRARYTLHVSLTAP